MISIVLSTASESDTLSVTMFPIVNQGIMIAFPVTNYKSEYSSFLTQMLYVYAAALTRVSVYDSFSFSNIFLIVMSADAKFLSSSLFDHGEYAGPNLTDILCLECSIFMFENSLPLSAQKPTEGILMSKIQSLLMA